MRTVQAPEKEGHTSCWFCQGRTSARFRRWTTAAKVN